MTEQRRPLKHRRLLILVVEDDYFVADGLYRELEDQRAQGVGAGPQRGARAGGAHSGGAA